MALHHGMDSFSSSGKDDTGSSPIVDTPFVSPFDEKVDAIQKASSLFQYQDKVDMVISPSPGPGSRGFTLSELTSKGMYGELECRILDGLFTYCALNRFLICSYLDLVAPSKSGEYRLRLRSVLKKMMGDGMIYTIRYDSLVVYVLSESARDEWHKKKPHLTVAMPDLGSAPQLLEYLSVAQYHMTLKGFENAKGGLFYQTKHFGKARVLIPSYIELHCGTYRYSIIAFPAPKSPKASIKQFVGGFARIWDVLKARRTRNVIYLFVVLVSTRAEMEALDLAFRHIAESKGRRIYYALDEYTAMSIMGNSRFPKKSLTLQFFDTSDWDDSPYELKTIDLTCCQ